MKCALRLIVAAVVALSLSVSSSASAQSVRQGFWFTGGLGYGSLGCQDCDWREGAWSGELAIGGTLSPKFQLGVSTNGWNKSENGATLTVATLTALAKYYPSATGGLFFQGGLGVGSIRAELEGFGEDIETGPGVLLGLGYDLRVGSNVSLTPYWNGFATATPNSDANVGQFGLGVTLH
jgi:hypothetical protein